MQITDKLYHLARNGVQIHNFSGECTGSCKSNHAITTTTALITETTYVKCETKNKVIPCLLISSVSLTLSFMVNRSSNGYSYFVNDVWDLVFFEFLLSKSMLTMYCNIVNFLFYMLSLFCGTVDSFVFGKSS